MSTAPILTLTLNPALDVTTSTHELHPRRKLRCTLPVYDAGGGGVNVSRAIKVLGGESTALVALGGSTGEQYRQILLAAGISHEVVPAVGETRFSLTVMEEASHEHFRFVLPGPVQDVATAEVLVGRVLAAVERGHEWVVASGSLPPGLPDDTYARLALHARAAGAKFIIDSAGPALGAVLSARPQVVRLNHFEAQELVGGDDPVAAAEALPGQLIARGVADIVIVTVGDDGAIVATATERFRVRAPKVPVTSTVGAGDSFVGALALGFSRNWPLDRTVSYAVAAAAAAVMTPATELCRREDVDRLVGECVVERPTSGARASAS